MNFLIFLLFTITQSKELLSSYTSSRVRNGDAPYTKQYPSFGKVNYYAEYLGTVPRTIPEVKSEGILAQERIPKFNHNAELTSEEKYQIFNETNLLFTSITQKTQGTYDAIDKNGYLYLNGKHVEGDRKLYKHIGSLGLYLGNVTDDEPAIVKKMVFVQRGAGYSITGLYEPPGEVITIRISEKDLEANGRLRITIGQVLADECPNNIWFERNDFNRWPILANTFELNKNTATLERDGTDYLFYIGSFLGGPIYVKTDRTETFTLTISGGVRYPHFILGYTSPEEFADNWKSSAPYMDVEVWQRGILHSGPKFYLEVSKYEDYYKAMIYWEKVTSVSNQFPPGSTDKYGISMLYECFIAAGAAVSFVSRSTTNCPTDWFRYVTNPEGLIVAQGDTWGPHHEYNHQFQSDWGFDGDGEVSNNAVTLTSYSYFTKISSARTIENDRESNDWERYTSGSMVLNRILRNVVNVPNQLIYHACLLHCFGQVIFIKACQKRYGRTDNNNHKAWTDVTEMDMTYYLDTLAHRNITATYNDYKDRGYKYFVPVASIYQTGIGIIVKGKRNAIHTMQPFRIQKGQKYILNFTDSESGLLVPPHFDWTIKSITQPVHGTLKEVSENIYEYTPDPNELFSGQFNMTIGLTHKTDSSFKVDDIELYLELQQSSEVRPFQHGRRQIDRKTYYFPEGTDTSDVVHLFESNYEGYTSVTDEINFVSTQNSNTEIWSLGSDRLRVSELRGKFTLEPGKYRIYLRGRYICALFLSFDEGKTYQKAAYLRNEQYDDQFHKDDSESYYECTIEKTQWIYFKSVLTHYTRNREPYIGLGLSKSNEDGEFPNPDYLNAYEQSYEADPPFYSEDLYRRKYPQTYLMEHPQRGTLIDCQYEKWANSFDISNLFDDNDNNLIHTSRDHPVSSDNPFMIFVDLGTTVYANTMTIYAAPNFEYQPKSFVLMGGEDKDDLRELCRMTEAPKNRDTTANFVINFETTNIRYYKLTITETYDNNFNFVVFRYITLGDGFTNNIYPLDDEHVSLWNSWERQQKLCTFGHLWVGKGTENSPSKCEFSFEGIQFAVNSYFGKEFGSFDVYIDGTKRGTVNLNKDEEKVGLSYASPLLHNCPHVVTFEGKNNFNVDSFFVREADYDPVIPTDSPTEVPVTPTEEPAVITKEPVVTDEPVIPTSEKETTIPYVPTSEIEVSSSKETETPAVVVTTNAVNNDEDIQDVSEKNSDNQKKKITFIVGVAVGLVVAGALSALITFAILKKKRHDSSEAFME